MDTEISSSVSETQQQEEIIMEKEGKLELTEESVKPENPPAAVEEAEQLAVNGHATEAVNTDETVVAESATQENQEEKAEEKSEPSVVAPPESAESSVKISDPALEAKPESAAQQPEDNPEPLQTPELEKPAEAEPEEELSQVPAVVSQPVETQPPSQEEKVPEQVKTEPHAIVEAVEPAAVLEKEVSSEKPTAAATVKEAAAGDVKESETVVEKQVSSEKPTIKAASPEAGDVEPPKDQEVSPDQTEPAVEAVKSEQKDAEPQKEDVVPAAGSLSFAILEQEETKDALRISRTLVVLRGLPGSGKSFLARAIADAYKDQCSVFCADSHSIKPENPKSSADGYKALDDAVAARCGEETPSSVLIVVDDTNHTHDRLARLGEIADEHNLIAIFLEPQTEWSRDLTELKKRTGRGLEEAQLEAMRSPLEETSIPLFFGWFLLSSVQEKVRCTAMDFLKTLDTMEVFKKHLADFAAGKAEQEVDLEQYFEVTSTLHCTTKFCDYGKADGAKEYAQSPDVKKYYGSVFELSLTALFVTPRTVGARVSLTEEQLLLWPADAEKEAESASLPPGSRAHITLGCAEGVEPVQTGLDLLQILALQQGEVVEEMALGSLRYYSEGRWMLELREPICATACFSSIYARKEVGPTKKEHEKKKKLKCAIL